MPELRGSTGWDFATTSDTEQHCNRGCCRYRSRSRGRWGDRRSLWWSGTGRSRGRWDRLTCRQCSWRKQWLWSYVYNPATLRYCLSAVHVCQGQSDSRLSRGLHFGTTSPPASLDNATTMIVVCILFFLMAENVLFFFAEKLWVASSNLTAEFKRAARQTGSFPAIVPHTRCLIVFPL